MAAYAINSGAWPVGPSPTAEFYVKLAQTVEGLGYSGIFASDHLMTDNAIPECLSVLSLYAAATHDIEIGSAVLLLALRNPVLVAKQVLTLDHLTQGRLVLGVGVGGEFPAEWNAAGIPTAERGRRTDEALEILEGLSPGRPFSYHGQSFEFEAVRLAPFAARGRRPTVWIGGRSDKALERASRYDGWCAYAESSRKFASKVQALGETGKAASSFRKAILLFSYVADTKEAAENAARPILGARYGDNFGRFLETFCAVGNPEWIKSRVAEYEAGGATDVILYPQCSAEDFLDQIRWLSEILPVGDTQMQVGDSAGGIRT